MNKKRGRVIIVSGPSGSGKTTLYKKLLASKKLKNVLAKSISVTTREQRVGEKQGRDYVFVSRKMFEFKKHSGHFLESMKVFDNYYGTPKKSVNDLLKTGKNVLLCIDVKGASVVCRKIPKSIRVFIKTPSMEVLKKRLQARGSESEQTAKLRLKTAKEELKQAKNYDYVVVNDNINTAYRRLESIILSLFERQV